MRRLIPWIAPLALTAALFLGNPFHSRVSHARLTATPESPVMGFSSDQLLEIPAIPATMSGLPSAITLRGADGTSSPASLSLLRYTYEPGGQVALPYPFPGPVAFFIQQGTLTLQAAGPAVTIAQVERETSPGESLGITYLSGPDTIVPGQRYEVETGDYVYAMDGDLGPTRNDGVEPLAILAVMLQPESGVAEQHDDGDFPATDR